jgi:hypothetical protein
VAAFAHEGKKIFALNARKIVYFFYLPVIAPSRWCKEKKVPTQDKSLTRLTKVEA